jgi:hypothetical protein
MPMLAKDVVQAIAGVRKTSVEVIARPVRYNLLELFRDDPWLADTYVRVLGEQPVDAHCAVMRPSVK